MNELLFLVLLCIAFSESQNRNFTLLQYCSASSESGQILLAQDPNCKSHSVRTAADDSGKLREVEVSIRVLRQWRVSANGSVELTVCYGSRVLELAKGKDAVELASKDKLVPVLEQFKAAAEQGEMDDMMAGTVGKAKTC